MRVIPFPSRRDPEVDAAVLAELEAAFDGDGTGPEADAWRELRADVRSLPEPINPAFQSSLEQQLRDSRERSAGDTRRRFRGLSGGWLRGRRVLAVGTALALIAALVFSGVKLTSGGARSSGVVAGTAREARSGAEELEQGPAVKAGAGSAATVKPSESPEGPASVGPLQTTKPTESFAGEAKLGSAAGRAPGETPRRLQQLSAAISLGGGTGVQSVADRVGQVAVAAGGYVESSKVELQHGAAGEATLTLKIPSAKLAATLATLQRLAPVRAETQELQDLTGSYNAVAGHLAAARAERDALLRALSSAESAAAIESLHQRIANANATIAAAERQEARILHTASEAQVEVAVLGESAQAGGGLTIGRGLHDAGHVLTVLGAALLIALAVLVPLALVVAALSLSARWWRRHERERALDSN